jgi:hypothetical protein
MHAIHSEGAVGVLSARATVVAISVCAVFAGLGLKREAEYKAHDQLQHVCAPSVGSTFFGKSHEV